MIFYLQQHEKGGRWLIDATFPNSAYRVSDSRDASEWLAAKKAFGFELSPAQEFLLHKHEMQRREAA